MGVPEDPARPEADSFTIPHAEYWIASRFR
jgi:hypothetical protein